MEYIEREAAVNARNRSCQRNCKECDFAIEGDSWCKGEVFVVDLLRIPAADVKPVVRGRWIYHPEASWKYECSECGSYFPSDYCYCANCGAEMEDDLK